MFRNPFNFSMANSLGIQLDQLTLDGYDNYATEPYYVHIDIVYGSHGDLNMDLLNVISQCLCCLYFVLKFNYGICILILIVWNVFYVLI